MKNSVLILIIFFSLASCVTRRACDRKFPPVVNTETIIKDTTIITERTKFDTIYQIRESRDTVFFHDLKTQIKIKYIDLPGDSIFIEAECPPDTVTVTKETITNNIQKRESSIFDSSGFLWICGLFIFGMIMIAVGYLIKQIKR